MTEQDDVPPHGLARRWGTVHTRAAIRIDERPERLVAQYLDFAHWPDLFPATIRGTRLVRDRGDEIVVEVDHRTADRVVNVLRRRSAHEIELEERKPRYRATFLNRFDDAGDGTRYTVVATVSLSWPYALLGSLLAPYVRRAVRRYVLEPMRDAAERDARHAPAHRA